MQIAHVSFIGRVIGESTDADTPHEGHYRPETDPIIGASLLLWHYSGGGIIVASCIILLGYYSWGGGGGGGAL